LRDLAYQRLDNIDRLILLYKADVAASRGTQASLTAAIEFLRDADQLTSDPTQEALIAQKISDHEASIAALEEQAAAEQAAAEAEAEAAQQAEAVTAAAEAEEKPEGAVAAGDH
jgi:predicted nucleotidyltransferase